MNSALKWKLIAGFVLVFLAGGATGVFVSAVTAHHFFFGQHPHGFAAQAMKNRLQRQLRLTDEQLAKISPIIEKTGAQLEAIRGDTGRRVRDTIAEAHREIAPNLTPEQQQRLKEMEARHHRWFQNHRRGHAGPGHETSPEIRATPAAGASPE
jgi:Spy/CpxP family protein refolding chaperone